MATRTRADAAWEPRDEMTVLNTDIPRVDGPAKVTGVARYTHDIRLPGMVYARFRMVHVPRAEVIRVDVEAALKLPGVVYAEALKKAGDDVRYLGDDAVVAVVAGTTPEAAEDALRAIVVELEELEPVVTPEQARAEGAPVVGEGDSNLGKDNVRGDEDEVLAAYEAAPVKIEATYTLPIQHHVCLETHGVVVDYRGGDEATIYASTQAVSGAARGANRAFGIEGDKVRLLTEHMGGGFGAKFGLGFEGMQACRVANALERPVHLMLTRPDEFLMGGNRSGSRQHLKGAADAEGKLVALWVDADRLGGMGGGALPTPPYIYKVKDSYSSVRSVHTATDSNRAMRAPGHPQASFAMEGIVDELAYAAGIDPLTFRKNNLDDEVWHRQLDRVAKEIGWSEHAHKTKPGSAGGSSEVIGIGFGVSIWGSGSRAGSKCEVRIEPDGTITASSGSQDLGTGTRTYLAAIVAEEFGLAVGDVVARLGDNRYPTSAASGGSVTTGSFAPAIKDAAHQAREALEERVARVLDTEVGNLHWDSGNVHVKGDGARTLTWRQACATLGAEPLTVLGEWRESLRGTGIHGAQAAKVAVDPLTGGLRVLKMVCVQDQGLPLNRLALRSQINGGMIQALSYGLHEERVFDPDLGLCLTANLEDYKIAGCQEIPEMLSIIDDDDDRQVVMGMAEATVIPGHSAIANAIYNACGVRLRSVPFTSDKVLLALAERS